MITEQLREDLCISGMLNPGFPSPTLGPLWDSIVYHFACFFFCLFLILSLLLLHLFSFPIYLDSPLKILLRPRLPFLEASMVSAIRSPLFNLPVQHLKQALPPSPHSPPSTPLSVLLKLC